MNETLLAALNFTGVAIFAATGALAASRKELDMIGFIFFAAITGIGGGTLRDVLLGDTPVFWVADGRYIMVCLAVAVLVYFTAHLAESRYTLLLWADAAGLAAYCVLGAAKGLEAGAGQAGAVVMGLMTATFGGIIRDVLAGERSVILRKELYLTPALIGAGVYVVLFASAVLPGLAAGLGVSAAFAVRAGALMFGWTMPTYKARPGRDYPER